MNDLRKEKHLERKGPFIELLKQLQSLQYAVKVYGPVIASYAFADLAIRWLNGAPTRRFSIVQPTLQVGGQYSKFGWPQLKRRGVTAVVNMRREYDDEAIGIAPLHYLHLHVIDNTAPSFECLQEGVEFLQHEIANGGRVYIHCAAGVGRAPTMAAAYLVSTGLTPEQAWTAIRKVRPFIRPTPDQVHQIDAFAELIKAKAESKTVVVEDKSGKIQTS